MSFKIKNLNAYSLNSAKKGVLENISMVNRSKVLYLDECGYGRPNHRFPEAVILPNSTSPPGPLSKREGEIPCIYNNIS